MNQEILQLQPQSIWKNFNALNAVPRASKKEERVIAFIEDFGKSLGLETITDKTGNVVIRKPATAGMEDRKGIVLQSHLDMVHQKNNDTVFDFDADGIRMLIDGDWVKADGTTLGADNGIGVATIMAILESQDLAHPAIDALFTIDEETGMTGAFGLEGGVLQGQILLNLDTENDTEIDIGCAGGIDVTATKSYSSEPVLNGYAGLTITVRGLNGGHSGIEIHKGLGNANKIMNRVLFGTHARFGLRLSEIKGGGLRNAIPRESFAKVVLPQDQVQHFISSAEVVIQAIKAEYKSVDAGLEIIIEQQEHTPVTILPLDVQEQLIKAVYAAHNGVYRMSADFADLVETSNNIANIEVKDGKITIKCLTRSSVESSKYDLANALKSTFELMGAEVGFSGDYPGWTPDADSQILQVLKDIYQKQYNEQPEVVACHAGLECGILGRNYPGMDMISFGPTILGAHSPAERVSISSVQKFWKFTQEILVNIPKK
ncbi:aminoacyl-histidine dipeptidase [Sphingobacterium spiritivorum]|uniref:aminoacyl-histidine dipeptidase n=1 Tax=Sphingobacterium spiritivorum TaxID=258 RepID=UPI001919EC77|nr:aminoacyl-histidine dipeptidase [Sphingobacterium spiritivorum]QQT25498.1 aminoacyl-histidine dipeptidase [Sphingobacterium spiritivorum]